MLKIKVNNEYLDLGELKGITFKKFSPYFKYQEIKGDYSLPFNLPISERNSKILDFPYRVESIKNDFVNIAAEIWHSEIIVFSGFLNISQSTAKSISCNFVSDGGELAAEDGNKLLKDINLGSCKYKYFGDYSPAVSEYAMFPVQNNGFWEGTEFETPSSDLSYLKLVNYNYAGMFQSGNVVRDMRVTPFPYLYKIIKKAFSELGFLVQSNIFETYPLNYLVLYNNNNSLKYVQDENGYLISSVPETFELNNFVPNELTIKDLIKNLQNYFNVTFIFQNKTLNIVKNETVINSQSFENIQNIVFGDYTKTITKKKEGISIKMGFEHDKTFDVLDSIDEASQYFFKEDAWNIDDIPEAIVGDALITHNPGTMETARSIYTKKLGFWSEDDIGYRWELSRIYSGIGEALYTIFNNYHRTGKEIQINSLVSPLAESTYGTINNPLDSFNAYIPYIDQKGNGYLFKENNSSGFRLLFFQGNKLSRGNHGYLYPSGGKLSPDEQLILGYYGDYGIINNFWKDTIEHLLRIDHYINTEIKYSITEIKHIDFSKKLIFKNVLYFLDEIDITLYKNDIALSKCKLVPV